MFIIFNNPINIIEQSLDYNAYVDVFRKSVTYFFFKFHIIQNSDYM